METGDRFGRSLSSAEACAHCAAGQQLRAPIAWAELGWHGSGPHCCHENSFETLVWWPRPLSPGASQSTEPLRQSPAAIDLQNRSLFAQSASVSYRSLLYSDAGKTIRRVQKSGTRLVRIVRHETKDPCGKSGAGLKG